MNLVAQFEAYKKAKAAYELTQNSLNGHLSKVAAKVKDNINRSLPYDSSLRHYLSEYLADYWMLCDESLVAYDDDQFTNESYKVGSIKIDESWLLADSTRLWQDQYVDKIVDQALQKAQRFLDFEEQKKVDDRKAYIQQQLADLQSELSKLGK